MSIHTSAHRTEFFSMHSQKKHWFPLISFLHISEDKSKTFLFLFTQKDHLHPQPSHFIFPPPSKVKKSTSFAPFYQSTAIVLHLLKNWTPLLSLSRWLVQECSLHRAVPTAHTQTKPMLSQAGGLYLSAWLPVHIPSRRRQNITMSLKDTRPGTEIRGGNTENPPRPHLVPT